MKLVDLGVDDIELILPLLQQLNPNLTPEILRSRLSEMFTYSHYLCLGLLNEEGVVVGISSGWLTTRIYSGKQLELDNVIVDNKLQSNGVGGKFLELINSRAKQMGCETIELNTYVSNDRSHKFYFKQGYKILGFHFQKKLEREN
ncbi:GNAT family N-acetyltransferase [Xanthovirga aplysinae]|uniref:GNAT family N-acetyltransferase n=1 Tax=Xanthovirga aplysinae TaxID=2529853 RepID=UPI0012BB6C54|nr:GNAT family N-acetyltransferase [Xanthovirga aplysinae]MTI30548.1 GNAT family N-acetyltransferase [Xanthovirga aplysinae]